jgi:GTPase SAR1 family protein
MFKSVSDSVDGFDAVGRNQSNMTLIQQRQQDDEKINAFRIVLLGTSESGKSTLCKQYLSHIKNNSEKYLRSFVPDIHENLRVGTAVCLAELEKQGKILENYFTKENITEFNVFNKAFDPVTRKGYSKEFHQVIIRIWRDKNIQQVFLDTRHKLHLPDGYEHLLNFKNIERYKEFGGFVPTVEDVVYCHSRTLGLTEMPFEFDKNKFVMVDTGGVRSERKKWHRTYEQCSLMVYVVSLSDYDATLSEDFDVNRMRDALELYEKTINTYPFNHQKSVLIFNKSDLLERDLNHKSIAEVFPNYKEMNTSQEVISFIKNEFLKLVKGDPNRILTKICRADKMESVVPLFDEILTKYF